MESTLRANSLRELQSSHSWLIYLAQTNSVDLDLVEKAIEMFIEEAEITGDYDLMPIRRLRNEFTFYLKRVLKDSEPLILFRAKSFYNSQECAKTAFNEFKDILFGKNNYKRPMYHILRIPEQLTGKEFEELAPKIKSVSWERFVQILHTIESNEKYTAGQTNLNVLLIKWLNF